MIQCYRARQARTCRHQNHPDFVFFALPLMIRSDATRFAFVSFGIDHNGTRFRACAERRLRLCSGWKAQTIAVTAVPVS
jgi:hypothetical protein